jgi:LPS sulfotransferase NodH
MIGEQLNILVHKAQAMKARSTPYLRNLALETGLSRGQMDYTRFIILGRSRVGSNFLRGLLNSHSQIAVFGEIFQNKEEIGWAMPGYRQNSGLLQLFREEPVRFLETKVFRPFPREIAAAGFKLFYYHAQDDAWRPVWDYLRQETGIKIIHIRRANILKTHLSKQQAEMTDIWVDTGGEQQSRPGVALSYESCREAFTQTRAWEREVDTLFASHDRIEIVYEELAADYAAEMARVQAFLGVPPEAPAPETYKQPRKPLSQAILNYDELKEQFAGTEWSSFFVE